MSSFVLNKAHIDLLAAVVCAGPQEAAGDGWHSDHTPDDVGKALWLTNQRNVAKHYREPVPVDIDYTFEKRGHRLTALEALRAFDCYDYQTCDTDVYEGSDAQRMVETTRARLVSYLPGIDLLPWEWNEEHAA